MRRSRDDHLPGIVDGIVEDISDLEIVALIHPSDQDECRVS